MYSKENIVDAYFIKDDRTLVNVIYTNKDSGKNILETLIVDAAQFSFQKLLEIYTLDQIEENTKAYIQREKKKVATIYQALIDENEITRSDMKPQLDPLSIIRFLVFFDGEDITDGLTNEERLFEMKIACFDLEEVENGSDELKEKIRVAGSPLELINTIYDNIHNS